MNLELLVQRWPFALHSISLPYYNLLRSQHTVFSPHIPPPITGGHLNLDPILIAACLIGFPPTSSPVSSLPSHLPNVYLPPYLFYTLHPLHIVP